MFRFLALLLALAGASAFTPLAGVGRSTLARRTALRMSEEAEAESSWTGAQPVSAVSKGLKTVFPLEEVAKVLPHRYPFALVDKVVEFEAGKRAVGIKCISNNEPQFTGHFPDRPIMPGVLMVEAMAQLGGMICLQEPVSDGKGIFFFGGVDGVKFRKPVVPGDVLVMEMELLEFKKAFGVAKMTGQAFVDGKPVCTVREFTFALAKDA